MAASADDWDNMSRERKVLLWITYWLDWAEERGITELVPSSVPQLSQTMLDLIADARSR